MQNLENIFFKSVSFVISPVILPKWFSASRILLATNSELILLSNALIIKFTSSLVFFNSWRCLVLVIIVVWLDSLLILDSSISFSFKVSIPIFFLADKYIALSTEVLFLISILFIAMIFDAIELLDSLLSFFICLSTFSVLSISWIIILDLFGIIKINDR